MHDEPAFAQFNDADLVSAMRQEILLGGPEDEDDWLCAALYWHARQYMHGVCTLLAMHLRDTMGLPVIILEGRPEGDERWMLRHAVVGAQADRCDKRLFDEGFSIPILDAAGGGTFNDRMQLYGVSGWEYRVVYADEADSTFNRGMATQGVPDPTMVDHIAALPCLSHALGKPFELRSAIEWLLPQIEADGRLDVEIVDNLWRWLDRPVMTIS